MVLSEAEQLAAKDKEFAEILRGSLPSATESLNSCLFLALFSLILPAKVIFFKLNNNLSKRDYDFIADDYSDICLSILIFYWLYMYFDWSQLPVPDSYLNVVTDAATNYAY